MRVYLVIETKAQNPFERRIDSVWATPEAAKAGLQDRVRTCINRGPDTRWYVSEEEVREGEYEGDHTCGHERLVCRVCGKVWENEPE